jgi:phospholipid/cholesterol/gamma-HCH transport system substrate-binding protein
MEPESRYTLVGAVVLALLALLVGAVLWLRGSGTANEMRQYRVSFAHQSLEGLTRRADVTIRGVRVGYVAGLRFSRQHPGAVDVWIAVDAGIPVLEGTRATVARNLLTGLATVQLTSPAVPGPPLRPGPGAAVPAIAEGQAPEQEITATATEIAQRLNAVLSEQNRAALSETLENVRRLSGHADRTLGKLDASLDALTGATRRVGALASAVEGDARTLTARYDQVGREAVRTLGEAGEAVRKAGSDVEALTRRTDSLFAGSEQDLQATTRSLRAAADSVGLAAERLREPSEIVYGPGPGKLGPGEGRK